MTPYNPSCTLYRPVGPKVKGRFGKVAGRQAHAAHLTPHAPAWYNATMSALLATLGAFVLILVLARLKVPLAAAIVAGALAEGLFFGLGPAELFLACVAGAVNPMSIALVVVTVLLLGLSQTMRAGGQLDQIVRLARSLLRRPAVAMAALPALIGLLPMPGGALLSAPMVESAAGGGKQGGDMLSAVNYWFRHIWEHWWPLYPGVILAMTLTGSGLGAFIAFQIPLGVFMAVSGLWIFRGSHPSLHVVGERPAPGTAGRFLRATSSIWVILLIWGAATAVVRLLGPEAVPRAYRPIVGKYVPLVLGLLVSLVWTVRLNRLALPAAVKILTRGSIWQLAVLVLAVMVFQGVLKDVEAAPLIGRELRRMHVPVALVVAILPLIAGLVTGLAVGFVGTSFPIVLGLIESSPSIRPYIALAYAFGHLGQMLSPLHLCHVVSNRYFQTHFAAVYRYIVPPAIITALLGAAYFVVLRLLLG